MSDVLGIDELLSEEEKFIRDELRKSLKHQIYPEVKSAFESGNPPAAWIRFLAEQGLFRLHVPVAEGGMACSPVQYGLVCQELESVDSALRSTVSVQGALVLFALVQYGTAEQKAQYLSDLMSGLKLGCFGLTEAEAGSDPGSLRTTAKKVSGGYRLNGSKMWISQAGIADIAIVWAKTESGIRAFIVEKDWPGFEQSRIHHKWALRASVTGELIFKDCFVPDTHVLPGTEKGLSTALACLTEARYGIAWGVIGAAERCFELARDYCLLRRQFGQPLAKFQLVQNSLADMWVQISQARAFNLQLGRLKAMHKAHYVAVSAAKMRSCQVALAVAREARNLLGGNGISLDYEVIRHMNNLEAVFTYEGTDNIHHLILGQHLTGFSAFGLSPQG